MMVLYILVIIITMIVVVWLYHSNSIYAQRTVERLFVTPDASVNRIDHTTYSAEPMTAVAHSDVKATAAGARSSYDAAVAMAVEAQIRRDELLAKYSAAASSSSQ